RRGQYGNLVTINHPNGYTTCYGHLSRISRGIRPGCRARQGDIIGFVGATGLASGPHLHYEVRRGGNFVNPLAVKGESGRQVPRNLLYKFRAAAARMDKLLASGNSATGQLPEEVAPGMAVSQVLKLYLL
ncbi:MAG: M23 family metallopeptidase, partial [Syntrophaceae bacterium]